ncbi:hypothetical protein ABB02_00873 [Clostridiaceae bacterium JG1575]|nr:hypothetical protein ABB02_00873 [Clostridiaceae bacterium JG1575]
MIYVLLALVFLAALFNWYFISHGLEELTYEMRIPKDAVEIGEALEIQTVIENRKRLPVPYVELHEMFPSGFTGDPHRFSLNLHGNERVIRTHTLRAEGRGCFTIRETKIKLGDFLGFSRRHLVIRFQKDLIVFPEAAQLSKALVPLGRTNGDLSVRRWILEDPLMIQGVRDYTGREAIKQIHWPISLRQGRLMVRHNEPTTDLSCLLLINNETSAPTGESPQGELIEETLRLARAVLEDLEEARIPYGLKTNAYNYKDYRAHGYHLPSGLGPAHANAAKTILGRMDYKVDSRFHYHLEDVCRGLLNYSTILILTPVMLDPYYEAVNRLLKQGLRVILICVEPPDATRISPRVKLYGGSRS